MAESAQDTELVQFTEQVATALLRAVESRPGKGDLLEGRVTAGIWIDPKELPRTPDFRGASPLAQVPRFSRAEIADLTSRAPITRESVGRLNDEIASDPSRALGLLSALASDPELWDDLFDLPAHHRKTLKEPGNEDFIPLFEGLVQKLAAFREDLTSLTFDINPPAYTTRKAAAPAASKRPAWMPDKVEVKGTAKNGGYEATVTVTWTF